MEEIVAQIANVGFPIAVAAYLLVRVENKLDQLSRSLTELAQAIYQLQTLVK